MTSSELVESLEGCRLYAYPDPATKGEPYTIGFGHTGRLLNGTKIILGMRITIDEAKELLAHDLYAFGSVVDALVRVPLTESMRSALISFAFNEGSHRLSDPHCKVIPLLNAGDYLSAAGQLLHWTMANGIHGFLLGRRAAEVEAFLSDIVTDQGVTVLPI